MHKMRRKYIDGVCHSEKRRLAILVGARPTDRGSEGQELETPSRRGSRASTSHKRYGGTRSTRDQAVRDNTPSNECVPMVGAELEKQFKMMDEIAIDALRDADSCRRRCSRISKNFDQSE